MPTTRYFIRKILEGLLLGAIPILFIYLFLGGLSTLFGLNNMDSSTFEWLPSWDADALGVADSLWKPILLFAVAGRLALRVPIWMPEFAHSFYSLPWKIGKPLPGGPIFFSIRMWAGLFSFALLGALLLNTVWWKPLLFAIAAHIGVLSVVLLFSNAYWSIPYLLSIVLLSGAFYESGYWINIGIAFACYWPITYLVLKSLESDRIAIDLEKFRPTSLMWPAAQLLPATRLDASRRKGEWLLRSICLGLLGAVMVSIEDGPNFFGPLYLILGGVTFAILLLHMTKKLPPVTLIGRFTRGPVIFPGYDRVFIPILVNAAVLVVAIFARTLLSDGWDPVISGLVTFVCCIVCSKLFPSSEYWEMMAPGRLPNGARDVSLGGLKSI